MPDPDLNPLAPGSRAGSAAVFAVAVETPRHSGVGKLLHYTHPQPLPAGTLVAVPLGRRTVPGLVWAVLPAIEGAAAPEGVRDEAAPPVLRPVTAALTALPPLGDAWRGLIEFAAHYYQRSTGELALSVLPPELRKLDDTQLRRRFKRLDDETAASSKLAAEAAAAAAADLPALSDQQAQALAALAALQQQMPPAPVLLHGVTGSGKTEVYLRAADAALQAGRQALVLVPEINLTPQLEARFAARFPGRRLVSLHSALTPAQRLRHWLLAHSGQAELVLGTRLAIFASLPRLGLIVVDEEHDPSFKQQEGARYSARDLAVWRARQLGIPVLLGSATPSLETWQRVQEGRYQRLALPARVGGGVLPRVRLVDMNLVAQRPASPGTDPPALAPPVLAAIEARITRGEQSLVLLNRRGFAPVLHCSACGWKSGCPHCSAWRVFHKGDRTLRCHHCSFTERVPRACPDCGNLDIAPIGRGTEKLQEQLAQQLPGARVARIDADTTRGVGNLEAQLAAVHAGEVDVLVGTQMVAKGHDFRRITLVVAVNPDSALFSSDFRAPERLFALLMQAAGRAGRDAAQAEGSEMWVQTAHPRHPLFAALRAHDYEAFAASQLAERQAAGLPPFAHLALLRAEARTVEAAAGFLRDAAALVHGAGAADVTVYPAVPPHVARVADVERLQMLVEARQRGALQRLLAAWLPQLDGLRAAHKGLLRWAVDVDPLVI